MHNQKIATAFVAFITPTNLPKSRLISTTRKQQVHQNNESTHDTSRPKALTSITTGILPLVLQPFVANGATLETNSLPTTGTAISTDGRVPSTPPIPGMSPKLISQIINCF